MRIPTAAPHKSPTSSSHHSSFPMAHTTPATHAQLLTQPALHTPPTAPSPHYQHTIATPTAAASSATTPLNTPSTTSSAPAPPPWTAAAPARRRSMSGRVTCTGRRGGCMMGVVVWMAADVTGRGCRVAVSICWGNGSHRHGMGMNYLSQLCSIASSISRRLCERVRGKTLRMFCLAFEYTT